MKKLYYSTALALFVLAGNSSLFAMGSNADKDDVIAKANLALTEEIYVVTDKEAMPPSGDKHDYISIGPYWWPNPDTKDGLPYIRKDGEVNPERSKYPDSAGLSATFRKVLDLGTAYSMTKDERYAAKANEIVDAFFVDSDTKMNPNLLFGQFVPGLCDGRGIGIIETAGISKLLDGVKLVSDSKNWSSKVDKGLKAWVKDYLNWLQTHKYGIDESVHPNNHGTHYDAQSLSMYLFLGNTEGAKNHIKKFTLERIASQVEKDGSQPRELARTKSWSYATMNLRGWVEIAVMADEVGIDLWNYAPNGQCYMKSMVDWFIPYLDGSKSWSWQQIADMHIDNIEYIFSQAAKAYGDDKYNTAAENQKIVK